MAGGMGTASSIGSQGAGGASGPFARSQPAQNIGLGPPDIYPQDPNQKEDELTAVHVKQGFTQSYSSMVSTNDEYASAQNRVANLVSAKVLQELKTIQSRKEESNTLGGDSATSSGSSAASAAKRRQTLNTKDHFWFVTGRNKGQVDNWFRSLASGSRSLAFLAKKVPIFNKRDEVLTTLSENDVTAVRAVWFIKMTAAYTLAMAETNKTKKRQVRKIIVLIG
jgi:mediator of RNA polymerase II transcription subunit 12